MGNAFGQVLHERYIQSDCEELFAHTDTQLGAYRVIRFAEPNPAFTLITSLDPREYDRYAADTAEFLRKLSKSEAHVCDFLFIEAVREGEGVYDLAFEYGDFVNTGFQSERVAWTFVEHILAALVFLHNEGLPYPCIRKRYTVYDSATNAFKLLNPNCFRAHLDAAIGLYLNAERSSAEKAAALARNANRNVKEFGLTVLALLTSKDESVYLKSPVRIRATLAELRSASYSARLLAFLVYTIENRATIGPSDVRAFLAGEGTQSADELLQSYFASPAPPFYGAHVRPPRQKTSLPARGEDAPPSSPRAGKQSSPTLGLSAPRKIRRIVMRWCKETSTHREFIEYEDGGVEERVAGSAPTSPVETGVVWHLLLSEEDAPVRTLLTAKVSGDFERFAFMRSVVDATQPIRPALYHKLG